MPLWAHHVLSSLSFILTLVFISSILRTKRAAGSTMAWLIVICAIPYLGIPGYLILSDRKFGSRLSKKEKIYRIGANQAVNELSPTRRILRASGLPEAKNNSVISLLPTGVAAYDRLIELIQGARQSIHVTTFIFGNDPVGRAIVEALADRAKVGLDVRVLVDSLGATMIRHPSFSPIKNAGGKIAYFMPVLHIPFRGRTNLRNHRKLMVVDGEYAVLGGMNLAQEYLGPTESKDRWVDLAVQLKGGCVPDLQEIFLHDWLYATHGTEMEKVPLQAPIPDGVLAQVIASGPDVAADPLYDVMLNAIYGAKKCVWIVTPYFIPDESLSKALELAAKRGVSIKAVVPRKSNHSLADLARGSFIRQLSSVGVQFGFYPRMIHAKALLIDNEIAILGSANFDMRSLWLNFELGLALYSEESLQAVAKWISGIQNETTVDFAKASYVRELAEGVGRVLGPLL